MLHEGWVGQVSDYAIVCGWGLDGEILLVGDVAGGLYAFYANDGTVSWQQNKVHSGGLLAMSIHPKGDVFATSGQDGNVLIWKSIKGEISKKLTTGKGWAEHLKWSKDGKLLAVACSRHVYVFSVDGKSHWRSPEHPSTVSAIEWSKPTEIATACYGQVMFFDVMRGSVNQKLEWQGSLVSMALSPDGNIVACGSQDNSVHFWRRSTEQDAEMTGYPGKPSQLAFDETGNFLATGGSDQITVWNFQGNGPEGTLPGQFTLHSEPISSLTFANHGPLLASGARDGSVIVWFVDKNGDGNPVGGVFLGERVSAMNWHPNDRSIAVIDAKGGVTVWKFKISSQVHPKGFY